MQYTCTACGNVDLQKNSCHPISRAVWPVRKSCADANVIFHSAFKISTFCFLDISKEEVEMLYSNLPPSYQKRILERHAPALIVKETFFLLPFESTVYLEKPSVSFPLAYLRRMVAASFQSIFSHRWAFRSSCLRPLLHQRTFLRSDLQ